jgi:hypothetical protein
MKATLHGHTFDTEDAKDICNDDSPDGGDWLYQTKDGRFFLVEMTTYLDGRKLKPWEDVNDVAPELQSLEAMGDRLARVELCQQIIPLSSREAMRWCIKTQIPECFRGYLLDCI